MRGPCVQILQLMLLLLVSALEAPARVPEDTSFSVTPDPTPQPGYSSTQITPSLRERNECFYRGPEACPALNETCRCKRLANTSSVVCCDVDDVTLNEGLTCADVGVTESVTQLHIRNATLPELNIGTRKFRRLKSLSITDGHIKKIVGDFMKHTPLHCLNLSNNGLDTISQRAVALLNNLNTFDISHNNLTDVPNLNKAINNKIALDISANDKIPCHNLQKAKTNYSNVEFENMNKTVCVFMKTFNWFNTTEQLTLSQMESYYNARRDCWPNCTCDVYRFDYVEGKMPRITFRVDCSGKQMVDMPRAVPENTIVLNISNNNISTLKMDEPSFQNIRELYADNNQIESILSLEGTKFLDTFVALSLRNNKLKTLPAYVLSNIFDRNPNTKQVYLGANSLKCDCNTAKNLKMWILTKQKNILDYNEIMCDNSPLKVIELDTAKMCVDSKQNWTDYIYYIIAAEVLLLLFLVVKVTYDYCVFKTAGYLPWPANKMPKLPCDWLCE